MINPSKVGIGDYVTADDVIHDYAKAGDIFRLIDSRIPGEETSAVGWKVDLKAGIIEQNQAYKLPHDKISVTPRKKIAEALKQSLKKAQDKKRAADREYALIESRINGLLQYESKEEEVKALMYRTFSDE